MADPKVMIFFDGTNVMDVLSFVEVTSEHFDNMTIYSSSEVDGGYSLDIEYAHDDLLDLVQLAPNEYLVFDPETNVFDWKTADEGGRE